MFFIGTKNGTLALLRNAASSFNLPLTPTPHTYLVGSETTVIAHEGHDDNLLPITHECKQYLEVGNIRQTHARFTHLAAGMTRSPHHHHLHLTSITTDILPCRHRQRSYRSAGTWTRCGDCLLPFPLSINHNPIKTPPSLSSSKSPSPHWISSSFSGRAMPKAYSLVFDFSLLQNHTRCCSFVR